jgi:hypothetical protein
VEEKGHLPSHRNTSTMSHISLSPSNNSPASSRVSSMAPSKRLRRYDSVIPSPGPFTVEEVQQRVKSNPDLDAGVLQNLIQGIRSYPSQHSLITQVQGRPMSPRSVQNIVQADKNLDPELLRKLINCLALAMEGRSNFDHMQHLLLEECQAAATVAPPPITQQPFTALPNGYIENRGQVGVEIPCHNGNCHPARWIRRMDQGQVAGYTDGDTPNDLPIIINLYAPVDTWRADEAPQGLLGWFLSVLTGSTPTFATLCQGFDMLPQDNWGYVAEIDHFHALNKQCQATSVQIDQLLNEMEMLCVKLQLSQGRLEMGRAAQQVEHLCLGQHGARREHDRVHAKAVQANRRGRGHPF